MPSFGVRLKEEREQRGITLEEISSSTKIGTRFLSAIEDEHFEQLPGGIFNKGFVRAYARYLGLDEEETIAEYLAASGNLPAEKEKKSEPGSDAPLEIHTEAERSGLPWGSLGALILLFAVGFATWGAFHRRGAKPPIASAAASAPQPVISANDPPAALPAAVTAA